MAQATINKRSIQRLTKKLNRLEKPLNKKDATQLGKKIVRAMKKDIAKQKSPIRGKGSFPALQDPYKSRKAKMGKGNKPNLKLTGQFLNSLVSSINKVKAGWSTTIKFSNEKARLKEKGHREGANGQHERPIIPNADEGFNRRISKVISDFLGGVVRDIVRKK